MMKLKANGIEVDVVSAHLGDIMMEDGSSRRAFIIMTNGLFTNEQINALTTGEVEAPEQDCVYEGYGELYANQLILLAKDERELLRDRLDEVRNRVAAIMDDDQLLEVADIWPELEIGRQYNAGSVVRDGDQVFRVTEQMEVSDSGAVRQGALQAIEEETVGQVSKRGE